MSDDAYTVTVRDDQGTVDWMRPIPDPFICTSTRPGHSWRARFSVAWRVLRGRYYVDVLVHGTPERVEQVLGLDPDYRGLPGSVRRKECDAQMADALSRFAREPDRA